MSRLRASLPCSHTFLAIVAAAASIAALAGCSSSSAGPIGGGGPPANHSSFHVPSVPGAATKSSSAGQVSRVSVRYVNAYAHKDAAGPALDIYEGQTGQPGTMLVHDLAYGAVSAYVHPHLVPNQVDASASGGELTLPIYAVPTGEDPLKQQDDVKGLHPFQDDGSHPQITELLDGDKDTIETGPLAGLQTSDRLEKGRFNGTMTPDLPPPGTTELLADDSAVAANVVTTAYLMVDTSCKAPVNGVQAEPNLPGIFAASDGTPKSAFAVFPQTPGSHQVAVATTTIDANLTCAQLTDKQDATTTTLTSGQQVEVYVYGTSATDLRLAFAPVPA